MFTSEFVLDELGSFANNCDALDLHTDAEVLRIAATYISRNLDDFTAWLDTPNESPTEEEGCPACGADFDTNHALGCPEFDQVGRDIDDQYEIVKDREMGIS